MKKLKLRYVFILFALIFTVCLGYVIACVPDLSVEKITNISQTLTIYDKNGNVSAKLNAGENRKTVAFENIPPTVINALIATEDIRFYQHNGIDIKRICGAIIADIKSGSLKEGASTITQQLIKNSHLTNEKTFMRKINEAILAMQLERQYDKNEILEMYLNFVYFGRGAYGIGTAAEVYFNKNVSELTCGEAATLIGILKAPGKYAPHINKENALNRRNTVLGQMAKYGFISQSDCDKYMQEDIIIAEEAVTVDYGYYTDYVLEEAAGLLGVSVSDLLGGGYSVYTYQDSVLQEKLQAIYADGSNFPEDKNGNMVQSASVIIDNETGGISAMIGGREHTGMRIYNRATAKRQPGSCIKPLLVYAPALEIGTVTCATVLDDYRKDFNGYSPTNFKDVYYGKVTVREALSRSLNVPAVELLERNGVELSKKYASEAGIDFDIDDKYLALALGGMKYGTSAIEIAGAYSVFARNGLYVEPGCISEILDSNGNVLYKREAVKNTVFKESTAYLMTDMLCDISKQQSNGLSRLNKNIACKTGTVGYNDSGYSDAWCAAYVPSHTVAVWMGFDMTTEDTYLDANVTGSAQPARISSKIFEEIFEIYGYSEFNKPDSVVKLAVDLYSLKNDNTVFLAGENTLENRILYENFDTDNMPTQTNPYWDTPEAPDKICVNLNEIRYAEITFTARHEYIDYEIYRIRGSNEEKVAVMAGMPNQTLSFTDEAYVSGDSYYIVSVHKVITVNGTALTGEKSRIYNIH